MLATTHESYAFALSTPATAGAAIAETRTALTLKTEVHSRDTADIELGHDVNRLRIRLGMLLEATSHWDEAEQLYNQACEIAEQVLARPGERTSTLSELSQCRSGQGRLAVERKNWELALRSHRAELAAVQELASASGTAADEWNVVLAHEGLADALFASGDSAKAKAELEAARSLVMRRDREDAFDMDWKAKRASLERQIAKLSPRAR
jgi:tetratricopeptide (TPR) repeat protein